MRAALVGGLIVGGVVGVAQWAASGGMLPGPAGWAAVTAVGYGGGLAAGAALVGFGTNAGELAAMGAVSGLAVGLLQGSALAVSGRPRLALSWGFAMPALFALGWVVTTSIGVDVERHHAVFGSSGALVVTVLSGLILLPFLRGERPRAALTTVEGATHASS